MSILALDLGTQCGWAIHSEPLIYSGSYNLKPGKFDSNGQRYVKFENMLVEIFLGHNIDEIVYEAVRRHVGTDAAHVYGGLLAILQTTAIKNGIEYRGVAVQTIKKHATGRGNATKDEMIVAANAFYPHINIIDDNHADALCLLHYASKL